jgi:excisionase family DNA binding protein
MKRRGKEPEPDAVDVGSEIMTVRQVAEYLHCTPTTVYRLIKTAGLPGFRLGGDFRFLRADLQKWIARQHVRPASK